MYPRGPGVLANPFVSVLRELLCSGRDSSLRMTHRRHTSGAGLERKMQQSHRLVAAFLCAAFLAACGGNSGLSSSMPPGMNGWNNAPVTFASFPLADAKATPEFVLDVGAVTGNLYVYQVSGSGKTLIGVIPSSAGGFRHAGQRSSRKHARPGLYIYVFGSIVIVCNRNGWMMYVGQVYGAAPTGAIVMYAAKVSKGKLQITQGGTLQQSTTNGGLGLAVDSSGNLYASNSETNAIDVFTAAELKRGSGKPARTIHTKLLTQVDWLATAGKTLLANGLDESGNYDVTDVSVKTGADKLVNQVCASKTAGTCYPGGMEVGPRPSTVLYVNNETNGTIGAYAPPWTGSPTSTVTYPSTDLVEAIGLDTKNNLLWGGNQDETDAFTCGSQTYNAADNLGFTVPLKSIQTNTPPYGACVGGVPEWDVFTGTATTSMFKT